MFFSFTLDVLKMNLCIQLIFIYFLSSSINCDQLCSREDSRLVREYYFEVIHSLIPSQFSLSLQGTRSNL